MGEDEGLLEHDRGPRLEGGEVFLPLRLQRDGGSSTRWREGEGMNEKRPLSEEKYRATYKNFPF